LPPVTDSVRGMNQGRSLFSQLFDFASKHEFNQSVKKFGSDYTPRRFTYWEQFLCMSFAQLTQRESLRDIETCLRVAGNRLYHLGIRSSVSRTTLAKANEVRDYRIFANFAESLIKEARRCYEGDEFLHDISQAVYVLDSTVIDVCLSLFPWAHFHKQEASIRMNTLISLRGNIPCFIDISTRLISELKGMDAVPIEAGALYIFDRGYFDWRRLYRFAEHSAQFIIRAKRDLKFRTRKSLARNDEAGVRSDQLITPFSKRAQSHYPTILRRISYFDAETGKSFVFLTNNLSFPPTTIATLYRSRWQVELFFKWIKQHLRIKAFLGTSLNAVKTQIWVALCSYLLVAIAKSRLHSDLSMYAILQILSVSVFDKIPISEAFSRDPSKNTTQKLDASSNQLCFRGFSTGQ
jgi:hypothetical protein